MQKVVKSFCIVFGLALCQPSFAGIELPYPSGVERLMREQTENATLRIPVSPWSQNSKIQHEKRSGTATITTLQMRATAITPQQVATPIRKAMLDADFKIVLDCFSTECGGFDYRINTPIQSPPKMYINLRNFVSITGINGSDKIINVLISRIGERVYIQERRIDPATDAPAETTMMVPLHSSTSVQNIATTFPMLVRYHWKGWILIVGPQHWAKVRFPFCLNWQITCAKIRNRKLFWSGTAMQLVG